MKAHPAAPDLYASIRQTAARALLESSTLNAAVAEILRAISTDLDWPLALYWIAGPDDAVLRCRSIWASDALKRADVVEASRVTVVGEHTDDPARRAYDRCEPIWIDDLATQELSKLDRAADAFPICDPAGSVGAIELYASGARPRDAAMLSLMAEVGLEICEVFRREEAQATALEAVARSRDELEQVLATLPDGITLFNG